MNLLIKISFTLFLCSKVFYSQDCTANLFIKTDIKEASIFIDEKLVSDSGVFKTDIEKGKHVISIIENTHRWDSKFFIDTLLITDCTDYNLVRNFHSEILLDTEPQDVYVFKNDSLIGFTPLRINSDFDLLQLQKPGYLGKRVTRDEILKSNKISLDFIGEVKGESFIDGTLFKVLIGTAIALGATTAYFKLQADEKFEQYQITGDPALLDETDKLDVISGVSFVALQINFGVIIYMFLSD